jgi:hypothetical protein
VVDSLPRGEIVRQQPPSAATADDVEDGTHKVGTAFRISRVLCILGRPVVLGMGRWGSMKDHSSSERSVWYAFLMLGILPSEYLRTPFQTVS